MKKTFLAWSLCLLAVLGFTVAGLAADGKQLFTRCAGCHGADGSKQALGVSKPLKGLSADEVVKDLEGYKAKTFGGKMKSVMEGQAASLSPEDMKALGDYISKL